MRIAFLGTPEFALPSLQALIDRGDTLAIFTQPDRPVGRKAVLTPPPVKVLAQTHHIPVFQFEKIRSEDGVEALTAFSPDLMVTAAFGQLLSAKNLAIPRLGTINVHGSLLPRYRGASPIQAAILNGEAVTGVTTMFTDIGMDTGDMLLKAEVPIDADDTYETLSDKLANVGAALLLKTLGQLEAGTLVRIPQNPNEATICHVLKKQDGMLDFSQAKKQVHNRVRAMNPWPTGTAMLDGQPLKIWQTRLCENDSVLYPIGSLSVQDGHLCVQCADGLLEIVSLQLPGKKRMAAEDFLRGAHLDGKQLS